MPLFRNKYKTQTITSMNIFSVPTTPTSAPRFFLLPTHSSSYIRPLIIHFRVRSFSSIRTSSYCFKFTFRDPNYWPSCWNWNFKQRRILRGYPLSASRRETPYEVLEVSPSATANDIKRAYRKLALKYHPDVNKEANAQEKFMRIKHAYNTLMNSESRRRFDSGNQKSDFSYSSAGRNQSTQEEDEFYGFGDFFRDLQEEFRNWEATTATQGKPKSLWEELAEIGEEFVEFLEKELNITDQEGINDDGTWNFPETTGAARKENQTDHKAGKEASVDDHIDEVEAALAQLKRELGL